MSAPTATGENPGTKQLLQVAHFERVHLSEVPANLARGLIHEHKGLFQDVVDAVHDDPSTRSYPIASLLDSLSEDIHASLSRTRRRNVPPQAPILFKVHGQQLRQHPHFTKDRPDVVGVFDTDIRDAEERLPWHRVETLILLFDRREASGFVVEQAKHLLEARPDCPGVYCLGLYYGMYASVPEFCIVWADAAGVVTSRFYPLRAGNTSDYTTLASYVYSLYCPPNNHILKDPSITWTERKRFGLAKWTVRCHGREYAGCSILHCADVFDRRTIIFEYRQGKNLYMIKDAFWDTKRRQEEAGVLKAVHKRGIVPGVVRMHDYETVIGANKKRIVTAASQSLGTPMRARVRIVLASTGQKLTRSHSIRDLLMAIYDVNEAHRSLVRDGSILHRDMSANNLLIYPEHDDEEGKKFMPSAPTFISAVLKEDENQSKGLIIDFDNSATLLRNEKRFRSDADLRTTTGTPCFIARSVAAGVPLKNRAFVPMPELSGRAKECYVAAYSEAVYDSYSDDDTTFHGVRKTHKDDRRRCDFKHRADHDVESEFWSLAYTSMQLCPLDGDDEDELELSEHAKFAWARVRGHRAVPAVDEDIVPVDTRDVLLAFTEDDWRAALHPGLATLAPLFTALARQIRPEYALLATPPVNDHLHEAVRRLLLEHLVAMDDPIALHPEKRRKVAWDVGEIDVEDMSGWPEHWKPQMQVAPLAELPPTPEAKPKIMIRVPPKKRCAEEPPERDAQPNGLRIRIKRRKVSHS